MSIEPARKRSRPRRGFCATRVAPVHYAARGAALLVVASLLGGCAFLRGSATGTTFVEPPMRHMTLPGAAPRAIAYRGPFAIQEYVHAKTNGRSEALYFRTRGRGTALDLDAADLESLNRRWLFNAQAKSLAWLRSNTTRAERTNARYRRYRHVDDTAQVRQCMAFLHGWDNESRDPLFRPGQGYFGYYCAPGGKPLDDAAANAYLARISIAQPEVPGFHIGQRVPHDPQARAIANGHGETGWGIDGFPLNRVRHFPIGAAFSSAQ